MATDEKIDEVLNIVRQHNLRFDRLEARGDQLLRLIQEQGNRLEELIIVERGLNNDRFAQLSAGLMDVRKEVGELKTDLGSLDAKIDKVHESLSADINAFGEDLYETKRRVSRLEKKLLS